MRLGYARCSTSEQSEALDAQVARLQEAGCHPVLTDLESGRNDDRPGLLEAMALVKAGQVAELVITRMDRLGRHAAHADLLLALCADRGVEVRSLDGGIVETASPQGFLMARLQTSLAEMESRMLSLRIRRQFEVYRSQGRHLRRRKPFGYQGGDDHRLAPHPVNWGHALRVIEELRAVGSFSRVAASLPAWCPWTPSATNLQSWFVNPVIRGHIGYGRQGNKGWNTTWAQINYHQHPALIGEREWQELADLMRRTQNRFAGRESLHALHGLTGLLVCMNCGHRMRRNTSNGVAWWRCRHRLCGARGGVREDRVLPVVVEACVAAAHDLAAVVAAPDDDDPRVAGKRRDLAQLQELASRNPALGAAVEALQEEIRALLAVEREVPDVAAYKRMMESPSFFAEATAEEQRAIFGAVLREVRVSAGGADVVAVVR